jgi:hypothetical protein
MYAQAGQRRRQGETIKDTEFTPNVKGSHQENKSGIKLYNYISKYIYSSI